MKTLVRLHGSRVVLGAVVLLLGCSGAAHEIEYKLEPNGPSVVATYTPTHPYLAEYDRRVSVLLSDRRRVSAKLFPDTGGYRRGQLYLDQSGALYLEGFFDLAKIDARLGTIVVGAGKVPEDARYLGAFDYQRGSGWKFFTPSESPRVPLVAKGG